MEEMQAWAVQEFGRAELGDKRLTKRLVILASQRGAKLNASISESCTRASGSRAAYRFYDNDQVKPEDIQCPHIQATLRRANKQPVVLAVQDTTQADLTAHPHTAGVGYLQDLKHTGYLIHTTLLVTPQRVPLGILDQQVWVRNPAEFGKKHQRAKRATAEKESQKWLNGLQAAAKAQSQLTNVQLVSVGDSEADIFALFIESVKVGVPFLVRACRDRLIENENERHLWAHIEGLPVSGTREVTIPRQGNRPERKAVLSIRLARVELKVTRLIKSPQEQKPVIAWAVLAREEQSPDGVDPIEWKLLTNTPTDDFEQACERVDWYACRWMVELFHRTLKSGCRLEERQFDDLENIKRFLALDSVVAWHVMYATMVSRENPLQSCEILFEPYEWQALYCFVHKKQHPPAKPPSIAEAIGWVARLGGFTASRKFSPGTTVLWRGFSRLVDISQTWALFHPIN